MLPAAALQPVQIHAGPAELAPGALTQIWRRGSGGHKWHHYFPLYERQLGHLVGTNARLLEIGVAEGGSLAMWRQYFGPQATVVGIDINAACAVFEDCATRTFVRIGSQSDAVFLRRVVADLGPFDAIIDDGSHNVADIVASFGTLFLDGLAPGGRYLIEDAHATYWPKHRDAPWSLSDFCRDLIDLRHAAYWGHRHSGYFTSNGPSRVQSISVPLLAAWLDRIEIDDSVFAITKLSSIASLSVNSRNG